ncbi:MAG: dihydropteroate synthase [Planctomycetaceae bacterium]|nr:dihydropteroate synthase [Planctomycetaceae bacterium]
MNLQLRSKTFSLDKPVFMGIINVTPDSFSDGGRYFNVSDAIERALQLIEDGAGILDIGGESTRPGSDSVDEKEELRRVIPVIEAIIDAAKNSVPLSIDTVKPNVAIAAIKAGAEIINDVSPATSPEMLAVLQKTGAAYCLTHAIETPKTMQDNPKYENVVEEVFTSLKQRRSELLRHGIEPERIVIDPGLGFGKTTQHDWQLVENIQRFHAIGSPLLAGHSRKRFIAETFSDRDAGTVAVTQKLLDAGVQIVRLHEIKRRVITRRS